MNKTIFLFLISFAFVGLPALAQENNQFTLLQAVEYAKKNNPTLKNAKVDIEIARKKVLETTAMGIPQISGALDYTGQPRIPVTVVPNFINPNDPPLEFRMGISHQLSAKLNVNWLLLDGTYFLGLKAASQYVQMASVMQANTEVETEINVTKAYYLALLAEQSLELMESNIQTLQKTTNETKALFQAGFAELLDYQRLELQLSNIKTQKQKLLDQKEFSVRILKFQMGYPVDQDIKLSDDLAALLKRTGTPATNSTSFDQRPEMKILQQQQVLNKLNASRYVVSNFPSLSVWGQHQQNTFATEDQFSTLGDRYFGGTLWGFSLRVPIFGGMQRIAQYQQAKLEINKTNNNIDNLKLAVSNEVFQTSAQYRTALASVEIQKANLDLAKEIYGITEKKFKEGVGSSLEVTNANNDLKNAENNYVNAIYELLMADLEYKKAMGLIK